MNHEEFDLTLVNQKLEAGDTAGAVEALQIQLTEHPDPLGYFNLGVLTKRLGDELSALKAFEKAAELAPDQAEIWNEIGLIYDELGKLSAAEGYYKKALEIDPEYAGAWNNWGVLAFLKGDFNTARERFTQATRFDSDNSNAWFNLRDTAKELGETDLAALAQSELDRLEAADAEDES